jgi:shikimate dehydrogenase
MSSVLEFVGVTTGSSSINALFPLWARELGIDARLVGVDLPLDAPPGAYREIVERVRDGETAGALVTTHKLALLAAARDLFDELDPYAERLGEVSCVSRRAGRVAGRATDPVTSALAMAEFLPADHFAAGGHVLCLGAGGAGAAIAVNLLARADRPARIVVTDTRPERLAEVAALGDVDTAPASHAGALVEALPEGSLVVNATGMGKDRPGSPLGDGARFPLGAVAWDLNYRGELGFLREARAQGVRTEDGWAYFLHGWAAVIAEVFDLDISPERLKRLRTLAELPR